jgi:hypothetical protein
LLALGLAFKLRNTVHRKEQKLTNLRGERKKEGG